MNFNKIFILDTNVILEDAHQLLTIGENGKNLIILPETTIDELDAKKIGYHEINYQAREFGRILSDAEIINVQRCGKKKDVIVMSMKIENNFINIISFRDYELDVVDKSILNDRKIIKVAQFATNFYKKPDDTVLLSNDVMCRTRAISLNVKSEGPANNKEVEKLQFIKEHFISVQEVINLEGTPILHLDPEYKNENYCYHFIANNGNQKLGYIVNGLVKTVPENELRNGLVRPLNSGQLFAMSGMMDSAYDVCIIEAKAGTGKTLLAIGAGIALVEQRKYDKIVYIRNSVESVDKSEEVGFLSGNDEKFKIYNYPLYDTLAFIAQNNLKNIENRDSQESIESKIKDLERKYNIETMWNGAIRGRTVSNSFVIIDEVQNFSRKSLLTVLSRLDKDCKVICIGSNRQIDNPYINKHTNGLRTLLQAAKDGSDDISIFGTELNKVVRGKITQWAEQIFETK